MLCAARLRHIAGIKWRIRRDLNTEPFFKRERDVTIANGVMAGLNFIPVLIGLTTATTE
jgi:type IV secretory pathway TrbD component